MSDSFLVDSGTLISLNLCDTDDTVKIASTLDFEDFTDEAKGEARPIPYGITAFPKGCVEEVKFI